MSDHFKRTVRVRLYKIVIAALTLLTIASTWLYSITSDKKLEPILGGLATGLIVALVQYLLDWNEHKEVEAIKALGIRHILPTRDNKNHYAELIGSAKSEILVLGSTASRMLEDFAHTSRPDSKALLEALGRQVSVKLLLPLQKHLSREDKPKAELAKKRIGELKQQFANFEARFFDHAPAHSIMKIDGECLVGPIFPGVPSRDSPTIHALADSPLVGEYLKYFQNEWENAQA